LRGKPEKPVLPESREVLTRKGGGRTIFDLMFRSFREIDQVTRRFVRKEKTMGRRFAIKLVAFSVALTVVGLVLGGTSFAAAKPKYTIGFSHVALNCPYYLAMLKAAKDAEKRYGVKVIIYNAEMNVAKQIADIEDLLVKGIDALVVNPTTEFGLKPAIKKVVSKDIPVVVVDRPLYGDYLTYVGIDQWKAGQLQGEFIGKYLNGKGSVFEMVGDPGCPAGKGRGGGFREVLEAKYPDIKILGPYIAHYNQAEGKAKMEAALTAFGDEIDLVYCHNDAMCLGALDALRERGSKIPVAAVDGQKEAYEQIMLSDRYLSSVINNSWEITWKAMELLIKYLDTGEKPPKTVITGTILVTDDNVTEYYDPNSIF
jgi:ribose transport system substrate-binding protein